MTQTDLYTRRHDLDWLRIIAFGFLIFYHIGMFYVSWGWHVKSVHAGPAAEPVMRLLNPWRLSLLFFISGVALRFALDKAKLSSFTWRRSLRLLIPIMFGIHVIVAPQPWLELLEKGEITSDFWTFYPEYVHGSLTKYSVIIPTWNHLWYIVYLLVYTWILIPFARPLAKLMTGPGARFTQVLFSGRWGILMVMLLPAVPHLVFRLLLDARFPTTHDLINDWANHAHSFTMFFTGFLLAKDTAFWGAVSRAFRPTAIITVCLAIALTLAWNNWDAIETTAALWPARIARVLYIWLAILTLLGAAQKWMNRPSPILRYMTEAIFPWYILHQTLIVMSGYWLTRQGLPVLPEFILVTIATFGGCLLIHELFIRRLKYIRPLFGLKMEPAVFGQNDSGKRLQSRPSPPR